MSGLLRFTREEWAEKPYLIEFRGGSQDGRRISLRDLPEMCRLPFPASATVLVEPVPFPTLSDQCEVYWRSGSVLDDGTHVFEFRGTN